MKKVQEIAIAEYDYPLPDERIAKYPLAVRDTSKLLLYKNGVVSEDTFSSLPSYIPQNSLMVFNNTKVIQARLRFKKTTGATVEVFCLEPQQPSDYQQVFLQTSSCVWQCLVGNSNRWKGGMLSQVINIDGSDVTLNVERVSEAAAVNSIRFTWDGGFTFAELLEAAGELPIPPYLNRSTEESDNNTYQTVYAKVEGSAAAPTAGFHFTEELFTKIKEKGIEVVDVTLHVGLGTFRPVKVDNIKEHHMHSEMYEMSKETADVLNKAKKEGRRIIAIGTTSTRTLESVCQKYGEFRECHGETSIFIYPGYKFLAIDAQITNFHLPISTLIMLVSAFAERDFILKAYTEAVREKYRFFSFGDSMFIYGK